MALQASFERGRSYEDNGPDTVVRSWVATSAYCGAPLAAMFAEAGAFLEARWYPTLRSRLPHRAPRRHIPHPLPRSVHFAPETMHEQWGLWFDGGHSHAFVESCPDADADADIGRAPFAGAADWHVYDDPKRSANEWSRIGARRVRQAWKSAVADADRRTVKKFTWCYQAGYLEGVRSPTVYLRDSGTSIWCELGSRARVKRSERYIDVPWGGMRRTAAVADSTALHLGQMLRELERIARP